MLKSLRPVLAPALVTALLATGCGGSPEARKQKHLESGNRYYESGKYAEAVLEYRNAIQVDARFGEARLKLAQTYERTGDLAKALTEYVRAADLLPGNLDVQTTAGNYLLAARKFDDAKARAEAVLKADAGNVKAHVLLGNALAGLKNVDEAVDQLEEAIRLDPKRAATYVHLGMLEAGRGRGADAEAAFKKTIELDPKWVPGYMALANHYWASGRLPEAEKALRAAVALDAKNPLANRGLAIFLIVNKRAAEAEPFVKTLQTSGAVPFALADFYIMQNRPDEAVQLLQDLRKAPATADSASKRLADVQLARRDIAGAEQTVNEMLQKRPDNVDGLVAKGHVRLAQGKGDEALTTLTRAAELEPRSARVQFALGQTYASLKQFEKARQAFTEVLQLNPHAAGAQVEIAQIDLASGKVDASVTLARDAVRNEPNNVRAQVTLARGLLASGDVAGAERILDPLLQRNPRVAPLHVQRAFAYVGRKNFTAARTSFERALEIEPKSIDALTGLVTLDLSERKPAAAVERVAARLREEPLRPDLLLLAGRTAAAIGDTAAAEQHVRKAVEADPSLLAGYVMLGQMYVSQKRLAEAKKEFESVATRQTRPIAALTMLGVLAEMQGDAAGAQRQYERVIGLDPKAAIAANNLAYIYADRGENLDVALHLARTAVEVMPESPQAQDTLGWVYYKKQTPELAVQAFEQTIKLDPKNSTYHYHLGLAYKQQGDVARARASLKRALAENASFAGAADAKRVLSELGPSDGSW